MINWFSLFLCVKKWSTLQTKKAFVQFTSWIFIVKKIQSKCSGSQPGCRGIIEHPGKALGLQAWASGGGEGKVGSCRPKLVCFYTFLRRIVSVFVVFKVKIRFLPPPLENFWPRLEKSLRTPMVTGFNFYELNFFYKIAILSLNFYKLLSTLLMHLKIRMNNSTNKRTHFSLQLQKICENLN